MLYNRRADWACGYYCCRELHKNKGQNWHRLLRTREKREWKAVAHKAMLCSDCTSIIKPGDRYTGTTCETCSPA